MKFYQTVINVKTPKRCLGNNRKHIANKLKYQI